MVKFGCVMFRKNLHAYAKEYQSASKYRNEVNNMRDPKVMRESILRFFFFSYCSTQSRIFNKKSIALIPLFDITYSILLYQAQS